MAATQPGTTGTPDAVQFIDKHDAGGIFLCRFEQVTYPGGTDADKHLDELGTRY